MRRCLLCAVNVTRLRFRDTPAFSAAIYFFRGYLLLPRRFVVPVSIIDIKSVLTQKGLDIFCQSFHIPDDVHPQLPSPNQTIHEMPTGKIGVYTRFFEFSNFRLPLSTFLVNVLRHYRINLSQLYVIGRLKFLTLRSYAVFMSMEFSADDYAVLVAHPAPFWKFSEPFLYLIGMSRNYTLDEDTYPTFLHDDETEMDMLPLIQVADPTKVKVGERERAEEEARLLDSTIGRVVLLLQVAPAHVESELEASVERLFNEGGSADQGDFVVDGSQEAGTELVTGVRIIVDENVVAETPKHPRKKRQVVTNASGSSHPPKKLRGDHGTSSRAATGDSSHHSSTNTAEAGIDSFVRSMAPSPVMTEAVITTNVASIPSDPALETGTKVISPVHASMFYDSDFTRMVKPNAAGSSHIPWKDLLIGSRDINSKTLHELAPPVLFAQIREMDYHYLFTKFNIRTSRQACLNAEVRMQTEYCLSERRRIESECEKQADLLKARDAERNVALENEKESLDRKVAELQSSVSTKDLELKDLNVAVHTLETTCSGLHDQVSSCERLKEQIEEFQDVQMNIVNDKEYLSDLGTAISRAIEKGMQDGLSADIDHGKAGRSLADVVAYNPAAKADYNSALQRLREVDLPLLAELKSHKNASVGDIMNLLRLEGPLADAPGMNDLQPNVDQLMLPIHQSEDQVVLGETSLLFALSVTHSRVKRIRENVAAKWSALIGVWTPLVDLLSVENLVGEAGTSDSVPATVATTTALSTTFASASSVPPITIEDYEIVGTDGSKDAQENGQGNVASFPTVEFEKEELDTTPERDPPS
ncbi:hypothetical protein Tco_0427385 [Tanacetum coccineum]